MERDAVTYVKYLKPQGKTVLDVGAANFDTAKEFLKHGAKKVICVERDFYPIPEKLKGLVEVYNEYFDPDKHLALPHDLEKYDIEGYEIKLPPYFALMKRAIVEVHSEYLVDLFTKRGWRLLKRNDVLGERVVQCLMVNDK
jgi:hypothetical protein